MREQAIARAKLGEGLAIRGLPGDSEEAVALLRQAPADAERLGMAEAARMTQRLRELQAAQARGSGRPGRGSPPATEDQRRSVTGKLTAGRTAGRP